MAYSRSDKAILSTLVYADIFKFPLSQEELWDFLIINRKIERVLFEQDLKKLCKQAIIYHESGFYCLKGQEKNIAKRKANLLEVKRKLLLAKKAAYYLSYIPTVYFIGISGGLAIGNVEKKDDIDLFIIAKKKTLFITRLWILALLELLHMRRKRYAGKDSASDKICVNLLVDETSLGWPKNKQDIYIAHEIMQLKPLFERKGMYRKFLSANQWTKSFLLHSKPHLVLYKWSNNYQTVKCISIILALPPLELLVRAFQKKLIRRHQTNESVSNKALAFHPRDYRKETLGLLQRDLKRLGVLTNI